MNQTAYVDPLELNLKRLRGGAEITFPASKTELSVVYDSVEIQQSLYEHDLAIIYAKSRHIRWTKTLYPGTPVRITYWGSRTSKHSFYGYVTHVKPKTVRANDMYEIEIYCIATSRDFRDTQQKTWLDKSAPEIVKEVAEGYGYTVVTRPHPYRKPQTIQTGETIWEFFYRLAHRIGYILRVEGSTLYFMPFDEYVLSFAPAAPKLINVSTYNDQEPTRSNRYLAYFHAWGGDTDTHVNRSSDDARVMFIDPLGTKFQGYRRGPKSALKRRKRAAKYQKFKTGAVAFTGADANLLAEGDASSGQTALDGQAVAEGDGYYNPYRPVYVAVNDQALTGWWMIKECTHRVNMRENTYYCDATLTTDSIEQSEFPSASQTPERNLSVEARYGWSPFTNPTPRLRPTSEGFVVGSTQYNTNAARWVSV